jgi:glycosyl transferase family 87
VSVGAQTSPTAQGPSNFETEPIRLLLALVLLFSAVRYLHDLVKFLVESPFIDFAHYYTYGTLVAMGLHPFDPHAIARVDELLHIRRAGSAANYPPLFYLFIQPWALLPFRPAAVAWFLAGQVCLLGSFLLCLRASAPVSLVRAAVALFIMLNFQPLLESVVLGQTNLLLLLLVTLAWWGLRAGYPWVTAGAVAVAFHIKVQYGLLVPLLWWMGRRSESLRAAVLTGLGLGVSLIVLGPAHHQEYLRYVAAMPDYLQTWSANLSPRATFHRLFDASSLGPVVADSLWLVMVGGILIWCMRSIPNPLPPCHPAVDWAWGLGLCVLLLLSPLTEEHHLVVLLLPLTLVVLGRTDPPLRPRDVTMLLASVLLLGSRYSFEQFPSFHQGILSLLMTGKLLGVIGLTLVLAARLRNGGPAL